jgi:hypothetical protein
MYKCSINPNSGSRCILNQPVIWTVACKKYHERQEHVSDGVNSASEVHISLQLSLFGHVQFWPKEGQNLISSFL